MNNLLSHKPQSRGLLCMFVLCVMFFVSVSAAFAQRTADSLTFSRHRTDTVYLTKLGKAMSKVTSSKWYQMTYAGVPLVVSGLIVKRDDKQFRNLRNTYLPEFNRPFDNYLQYAPGAVLLGLKAAGVQGRSSWGRMLVSDAFSAVLMGLTVNTFKHTTHVMRPNGSNDHSFPSGHTATAFMMATMLNKEYGMKSPWVGVGAYTVASATGLMRVANNKHWLSDVLTGAGIGILSTEFGYYLADLLFKDKGLYVHESPDRMYKYDKPTFVSLYVGINLPMSGYSYDEKTTYQTGTGSSAGVEGAYFFNSNVGVGGRVTVSNTPLVATGKEEGYTGVDVMSAFGGAYFSLPLLPRWQLGSKLLGGWVHYPNIHLDHAVIPKGSGFGFGTGLSLTFRAKQHYGMRFFADYNLLPSTGLRRKNYMKSMSIGSSFMVLL